MQVYTNIENMDISKMLPALIALKNRYFELPGVKEDYYKWLKEREEEKK